MSGHVSARSTSSRTPRRDLDARPMGGELRRHTRGGEQRLSAVRDCRSGREEPAFFTNGYRRCLVAPGLRAGVWGRLTCMDGASPIRHHRCMSVHWRGLWRGESPDQRRARYRQGALLAALMAVVDPWIAATNPGARPLGYIVGALAALVFADRVRRLVALPAGPAKDRGHINSGP